MTRRLRWLAIGAVLGIVGYRRLARSLSPSARSRGLPWMFQVPAFLRDVRAGMAEYERQHLADAAFESERSMRHARHVGIDSASQGRASQGRASQGRASQGRASQGRASQGRPGPGRYRPKAGG